MALNVILFFLGSICLIVLCASVWASRRQATKLKREYTARDKQKADRKSRVSEMWESEQRALELDVWPRSRAKAIDRLKTMGRLKEPTRRGPVDIELDDQIDQIRKDPSFGVVEETIILQENVSICTWMCMLSMAAVGSVCVWLGYATFAGFIVVSILFIACVGQWLKMLAGLPGNRAVTSGAELRRQCYIRHLQESRPSFLFRAMDPIPLSDALMTDPKDVTREQFHILFPDACGCGSRYTYWHCREGIYEHPDPTFFHMDKTCSSCGHISSTKIIYHISEMGGKEFEGELVHSPYLSAEEADQYPEVCSAVPAPLFQWRPGRSLVANPHLAGDGRGGGSSPVPR